MEQSQSTFFDDVELGDEIGPLLRGIQTEEVADFCNIWGTPPPNRFTDAAMASVDRLPGPIVPGVMSMAMMADLLTKRWPRGRIKHIDIIFRQPVPHGLVMISGVITDKRQEGEEYLVECDIYLSTEESGRHIGGKAVVALPRSETGVG